MAGWPPQKNATFSWFFFIRDADGDPVTGAAALDVEFSVDGGIFADVVGAEVDEGEGLYSCPISAAEMNGDVIALICKTSTAGAKTAAQVIYTSTRQIDDLAYPTVSGRSLDVAVTGEAGVDFNNILGTLDAANIGANAITAAKIAAAALDGKGDWNIGKTGYSLSQAFPANFADLSITLTTGRVDLAAIIGTAPSLTGGDLDVNVIGGVAPLGTVMRGTDGVDTATMRGTDGASTHSAADVWLAGTRTLTALGFNLANTDFAAGALDAAAFAADAITAAKFAADTVTKIRDAILPVSNVALSNLEFLFVSSVDHVTPVTGATVITGTRSIDGGAFVAVAGVIAEVGNGIYQFDATAADMNGGIITFRFAATGGTPAAPDDTFLTIVTGAGI